jgi:uncharacterized protein with PIN domain
MNTHSPSCTFRFYEELNDFLPAEHRKRAFEHRFSGTPSVKDTIEAIGIPHTEIDLILVDGISVDFSYLLRGGERVSVYPTFERLDIRDVTRLRPEPLREPRFVLDVHLGRLARYMRLLGFDAAYRNDYSDGEIIGLSRGERRIILTRDRGILKHRAVTHGHWMRNTSPREQLEEVVRGFDLRARVRPFTRCMECNGELRAVGRDTVLEQIPPRVANVFQDFSRCAGCARVYWRGSHYEQLARLVEELL